jgi:hypothetical protein
MDLHPTSGPDPSAVEKFFNPASVKKWDSTVERKVYTAASIIFGVLTAGIGHAAFQAGFHVALAINTGLKNLEAKINGNGKIDLTPKNNTKDSTDDKNYQDLVKLEAEMKNKRPESVETEDVNSNKNPPKAVLYISPFLVPVAKDQKHLTKFLFSQGDTHAATAVQSLKTVQPGIAIATLRKMCDDICKEATPVTKGDMLKNYYFSQMCIGFASEHKLENKEDREELKSLIQKFADKYKKDITENITVASSHDVEETLKFDDSFIALRQLTSSTGTIEQGTTDDDDMLSVDDDSNLIREDYKEISGEPPIQEDNQA